ncbi:UNVERIFIED_CONTAM: hypothetical protein K2H54_028278 [Gekko kuhli]
MEERSLVLTDLHIESKVHRGRNMGLSFKDFSFVLAVSCSAFKSGYREDNGAIPSLLLSARQLNGASLLLPVAEWIRPGRQTQFHSALQGFPQHLERLFSLCLG